MNQFRIGQISKDDLAVALRAHKAAKDAIKSPQREAAEVYFRIDTDRLKKSNERENVVLMDLSLWAWTCPY